MGTKTILKIAAALALCFAGALQAADAADPQEKDAPDDGAEVVELPADPVKTIAPKTKPAPAAPVDTSLDEDVLKEAQAAREKAIKPAAPVEKIAAPKPLEPSKIAAQPAPKPDVSLSFAPKITEPGFASVLTGTLASNTELSPDALPHLIRGMLVIPAKITLKINAGTLLSLRSDSTAIKTVPAGTPDPAKSAVIWIYGTLIVAGETGKPVEFSGIDKDVNASLLFYGAEQSKIDGARFRGADIAQSGGGCQWTNCEFNDSKYYALAAGSGCFTHCSFKKCGGVFAAYEEGPWALLVRKCLFENCRDGLLLNRDPGQACLVVEKNNFIGTRGANLRAMPRSGVSTLKNAEELLIGENWYGTSVEEEVDRRVVDNRSDKTIKAHLNIRPPAEKPYGNIGAGLAQTTVSNTLQEQQPVIAKLQQALAAKQKTALEKSKVAMDKEKTRATTPAAKQ